jgi:hypothetical protein
MPMPTPSKGERLKKFMSRFMGDATMNSEFPNQKQRYAVGMSQFKRTVKKRVAAST